MVKDELFKEFVPYDRALRMNALGFDEPCFDASDFLEYNQKNISIPTFSQAFRWFRKKYGLSGVVNESFVGNQRYGVVFIKSEIGLSYIKSPLPTTVFDEYEKAELACLDKILEIVESKSE